MYSGGEMVLVLTLRIGESWRPEYAFKLLPIRLEKVDILEAKLRDACEEIELLRAAPKFLSVTSKIHCLQGQMFVWTDAEPHRIAPGSHFKLSEDGKQITVLQAGMYQVDVCADVSHNGAGAKMLVLQVNQQIVSHFTWHFGGGRTELMTTSIHDLLNLEAGSVLEVQCNASNGSALGTNGSRFTILYVG